MARKYAEVDRFLGIVAERHAGFFQTGHPITVSRAPGRLDVMGGIADYSGSLVLEGTLREAVICAAQQRDDRTLNILSLNAQPPDMRPLFTATFDYFQPPRGGEPYRLVAERMRRDPLRKWAAYVGGVITVLEAEGFVRFERGLNIALSSDVPLGAGVSSSAAVEVAAMRAVTGALGIDVPGMKLAAMCQTVENRVVGAPCGIMDQVTSALGERGRLVALRCQPHELEDSVAFPKGIRCVGLDTNVKHAVGGSRYTDTRVGAFMGQRIIEHALTDGGKREDPTGGYLCNITPDEFRAEWQGRVPQEMHGADFVSRYRHTNDTVTSVRPDTTYKVRSRTEHPIHENDRVEKFRTHLERAQDAPESKVVREMTRAGKLMYASHWSYGNRCGMGSRETDLVVKMVRELGPESGFYGAKITGGGSGGTVAILCRTGTTRALKRLAARYAEETGREPTLLTESGPGAVAWGTREVTF